jgi:hypothetical protein
MFRIAGVYWLGPSSNVRYTVPPRLVGASPLGCDRCFCDPCDDGLSGRSARGLWDGGADGCLGDGLAVGFLRAGALGPGVLTFGDSVAVVEGLMRSQAVLVRGRRRARHHRW